MDSADTLRFIRPEWPAPRCVHAVSTTRAGGYSRGPWQAFNLADHVGDDTEHVKANRELLIDKLGLPAEPVWLQQGHGCEVAKVGDNVKTHAYDASITGETGVVCAVLTADCLPVLLCTKNGDRVAAVHAGWRGLAAGVIESTVEILDSHGDDLIAWLGPAIGPDSFEVGEEVYDIFVSQYADAKSAFIRRFDQWHCDLYALARQRLQNLSISRIFGGDYCTYSSSELFFSYRRDGLSGRMASLIWIDQD